MSKLTPVSWKKFVHRMRELASVGWVDKPTFLFGMVGFRFAPTHPTFFNITGEIIMLRASVGWVTSFWCNGIIG